MQIILTGLAHRRRGKTQLKIVSAGCQWLKFYFFISFMVNMYSAFVIIRVHLRSFAVKSGLNRDVQD